MTELAHPHVFAALRTPRGKGTAEGSLHSAEPVDLVTGLVAAMLSREAHLDPAQIDDLVLGTAAGAGGGALARAAAIKGGLPETVAGAETCRSSASGLEAIAAAARQVASGWEELVLAGAVESMSRAVARPAGDALAVDPELAYDSRLIPGGVAADLLATLEGYSREDLDDYSARSRQRATAAIAEDSSLAPVVDLSGQTVLDHDELLGAPMSGEELGALEPAFAAPGAAGGFDAMALQKYHWLERIDHVHTAGSSAAPADGAALAAIGSVAAGAALGLTPRARILAAASSGADPALALTGAGPAAHKALQKAGLTASQLDLAEVDEPFAASVLRFATDLGVELDRVNVNGGGIAAGSPRGADGAIGFAMLIGELERRRGRYGLVASSAPLGAGIAVVVEAV